MSSLEEQRHLLRLLSADASERLEARSEDMPTDVSTAAMGTKAVKYLSSKAASSSTLMKTGMVDMVNVIFEKDDLRDYQRAMRVSKFELSKQKQSILHDKFLTKLQYDGMYHREDTITVAHQKTFHWIFERSQNQTLSWEDFCQFLESKKQQRYWITGKPGAGKSTLMKFIT
jgi:DNA replication protein DnaC